MFGVVLEFFFVVAMLAQGPNGHLTESSEHKQSSRKTLCHDREREPGTHFVGVVRAGNKVEEAGEGVTVRIRNLTNLRTSRAKVTQSNVDGKVANFAQSKSTKCTIHLHLTRWSEKRMVDVICNIGSEAPIIRAVLK